MKLVCFKAQAARVAAMLAAIDPAPALTVVDVAPGGRWDTALREAASPGDALLVASAAADQPPANVFNAARELGLQVWSLSDHWLKAATLPDTADGGEQQAAADVA